jgi:hypothetical protein
MSGTYSGGTSLMVIKNNGNIGIGTTTPVAKLNVESGSDVEVARFTDESGNNVVIDKDGNLGIGTTSPGYKLEVNGNVWFTTTGGAPIRFDTDSSSLRMYSGSSNPMVFQSNYGGPELFSFRYGNDARMVIQQSGNVGIGTTTPSAKLHVLGSDSLSTSFAANISGATGTGLVVTNEGNIGIGTTTPSAKLQVLGSDSLSTSFAANISGATGTGLVVKNNGNIGIGTTSPSELLHLSGDSETKIIIEDSSTPRGSYIGIDGSDNLVLSADQDNLGSSTYMQFKVDASEKMRINYDGNVGIGTTGPSAKLHVLGSDSLSTSFAANISGATGTGLVVKNNGNVGIGTTGPTIALHVIGIPDGDSAVAGIFSNTSYGSGVGGALKIGGKYNSGGAYTTFGLIKGQKNNATDGSQNGDLIFSTNNTGNLTETMRLTYAGGVIIPNGTLTVSGVGNSSFVGNVGIGTTGPNYKLEVNGTFQADDIYSGDGSQGLTQDIVVKGSDGNDCTLTFKDGLLTAETCP